MRKRILVIMPSMFLGGAERSVVGLLESLKRDDLEVYLFLFRHEGELLFHVPSHVRILNSIDEYTTFDRPIKDVLFSRLFLYGLIRIYSKIKLLLKSKIDKKSINVWKSMQYTSYYVSKLLPQIPGEYDLAISFQGIPFYMSKVDAKLKMAWIHTDYKILFPDKKMDYKAFDNVDYIVTVSNECKKSFDSMYNDLCHKSLIIENIISYSYLYKQADDAIELINNDCTNLLSIGRFCEAKNFDNIPEICKCILDNGINIKWYLIGYGGDEELIRSKIKEYNMVNHVIIIGKKINPYPYIKKCDIYVQPSRYEGKAVAVREAQILNKPVIITDFPTANSQLMNNYDGIIVPMDNIGCAKGIISAIKDRKLLNRLVENTKKIDYSNSSEVEKIYKLMEDYNDS